MVRAPSIAFRMPLQRKFGRHTADQATQCPVQIVKFCPDRLLPFRKSGSETLSILYPRTRRSKLSIRFHPFLRLRLDAGAAGSPKLRPVEHPQPVGSRIQAIGFPERLQAPRRPTLTAVSWSRVAKGRSCGLFGKIRHPPRLKCLLCLFGMKLFF